MAITPSMMYWFTRASGIQTFCEVVAVIGAVFLIILIFLCVASGLEMETDDTAKAGHKITKTGLWVLTPIWVVCLLGALFVPTSKELAMIYVVPHIAESDVIKKDVPELYDMGVDALKDWLKKESDQTTKASVR